MQDYPNNDVLIKVIDAIDESKADKTDIVNADWNQTDETQKDYIKNKPLEATDDEIIDMLFEIDGIGAILNSDNSIITDSDNTIILI